MYQALKDRHRRERDSYSQALSLRIHRALSWLHRAEMCDDLDSRYIFLWIAFNAAYAQDFDYKAEYGERGLYQEFLSKIISLDNKNKLSEIVWSQYSTSIRLILDNEFVLQAFWRYQSGDISKAEWKDELLKAKIAANKALSSGDTVTVLSVVFSRLYTLRNQLIHGGATYNSSANRSQVRDCTAVLESVVPTIISLMMDGSDELWGDAVYPLIVA
ncbi:HEPN domain-containing protein [Vibrio rotiferianus]|uniref:HEPN domain-containing protein n=1 Tax=Vibrio rotiferianus TaxID=190895 RepID=UPI0015F70CD5|nr:HEPN domain-containing protein [Vibrio rotiferianus]